MCLRKFIIFSSIIFFSLIFLSTEIFSQLNILNQLSIRIFWISVVIISSSVLIKKKYFNKILDQKFKPTPEIFLILFIFLITFINAFIYAPNTLDAMTYHIKEELDTKRKPKFLSY